MTIHTVLCPVDLSPASRTLVRSALAIAQREAARLVVLHVLEPLLVQASALAYEKGALEKMASEDLDALIRDVTAGLGPDLRPRRVTRIVRFGEPDAGILAAADEEDASLIVMGTHGFGGVRKVFFGSTASRVIAKTSRPVLALRPDAVDVGIHRGKAARWFKDVIVGVDFSQSAMLAVEEGADLARRWGVGLVLVHAEAEAPAVERWSELLDEHRERRIDRARRELELIAREIEGVPVTVVTRSGSPEDVLVGVADKQDNPLLVLGVHRENSMRSAFRLGSTAYRALCLTKVPVLVVPGPRRSRNESPRKEHANSVARSHARR